MSGLGGLNKTPNGVVIGLVQLQNPVVQTPTDLEAQTARVCALVGKARQSSPTMDLVVFPEYSLHGLSMSTDRAIMCDLDGPEVKAMRAACSEHQIWGCFSIMERNPAGNPFNSGIIVDSDGELRLYYRKLHPWVPVEPWEPGDIGIPVCEGPNGSRLALIICHDGMFPEMARECAYKGAEIMIRTAGYTAPIRHAWQITNQANAFCNLMATASVCLCGSDGTFDSMGEAMTVRTKSSPPSCAPISCVRHACTGASRTTRTSSGIAGMWPSEEAQPTVPTPTCTTSWRAATGCHGRTTSYTSTARRAGLPRPSGFSETEFSRVDVTHR